MARDSDLKEQIGRHVHFDLVDFDKINSYRAPKDISIKDIKVIHWALWFVLILIYVMYFTTLYPSIYLLL